jgi:hypothetical protein
LSRRLYPPVCLNAGVIGWTNLLINYASAHTLVGSHRPAHNQCLPGHVQPGGDLRCHQRVALPGWFRLTLVRGVVEPVDAGPQSKTATPVFVNDQSTPPPSMVACLAIATRCGCELPSGYPG